MSYILPCLDWYKEHILRSVLLPCACICAVMVADEEVVVMQAERKAMKAAGQVASPQQQAEWRQSKHRAACALSSADGCRHV